MSRERSWGTCQARIKYHTSREYRQVSSAGCHLQFKTTNTLTWQAHPPQNSQASKHNHSKPFQHYQRANFWRISLLKKYLWHTWAHYTTTEILLTQMLLSYLETSYKIIRKWNIAEAMPKKKKKKLAKQLPFQACILLSLVTQSHLLWTRTIPGGI